MLEGNIFVRANGECSEKTRSRRPIRATHYVVKATSETLKFFPEFVDANYEQASMPEKLKRQRRQMTEGSPKDA